MYQNDGFCIKNDEFCNKMMDFVTQTMDFVFKRMTCSQFLDCLKHFQSQRAAYTTECEVLFKVLDSDNNGILDKAEVNSEFCIKNDQFCINDDQFCIKKDGFSFKTNR